MKIRKVVWLVCLASGFSIFPFVVGGEELTNAIHAFLQQRVEVEKRDAAVVVGIVDEHGSSVVSCGTLDNGTDQEVTGDTLFEIGSITKTFTALLLQGMVERGEMNLDDPVARYLPKSVRMPDRNGKQITLLHLVMHTSGLPRNPGNLATKREDHPLEDYTDEMLNSFLSNYELTRRPGAKFEYSNLGMGLLGNAIAFTADRSYESLVADRICRPLQMNSTTITLNPELKSRLATGHNQFGYSVPSCDFKSLIGCGALRSTANDLLQYLSANLGLTRSSLTPLMQKTHTVHFKSMLRASSTGLAWFVLPDFVWHAGETPSFSTFAGFDKTRRRGVVVLSRSRDANIYLIGMLLLESKWESVNRPIEKSISNEDHASYVGQYELSSDFALGIWIIQVILKKAPTAVIYLPAALGLGVLVLILCRSSRVRKRWFIFGRVAIFCGVLVILSVIVASHVFCAMLNPGIGIRQQGDRNLVQANIQLSPLIVKIWPEAAQFRPQLTGEFLPLTKDTCFERMTRIPITVLRDRPGEVTRLTAHFLGAQFSFRKISGQPSEAYEAPKPRVSIKLDTTLLDAYVGDYEFPPNTVLPTGAKVTIWRQGDQMIGQAWGKNTLKLPFDIYAESQTNFFLKINGAQLTFVKNGKGGVTSVIHHVPGAPDFEGKKVPALAK